MAGTTAAKRAPAKRTAKAAPRPDPAEQEPPELRDFYDQVDALDEETEDVSLDMSSRKGKEREEVREKLFSIDGVDYLIPKEFGPNLSLVFIDAIGRVGEDVAIGRVMRVALGKAGWEALQEFEDLQPLQLKKIMSIVMRKIMGAIEAEKGK